MKEYYKVKRKVEESLSENEQKVFSTLKAWQGLRILSVLTLTPAFLISLVAYFVWQNDWSKFSAVALGILTAWRFFRLYRGKKHLIKYVKELNEREV